MPLYEYECLGCGKILETFQEMDEEPLSLCPRCGGELRRVYSPPALIDSEKRQGSEEDEAEPVIEVPWTPEETDIHRGWKVRRKWKRDMLAAHKRRERGKKH